MLEGCPVAWAFDRACRAASFAELVTPSPRIGSRRHDIVVFTTASRLLRVTLSRKMKEQRRPGVDCARHRAYGLRCAQYRLRSPETDCEPVGRVDHVNQVETDQFVARQRAREGQATRVADPDTPTDRRAFRTRRPSPQATSSGPPRRELRRRDAKAHRGRAFDF